VAFGDYVPLEARGARARHVLAFARRHEGATMVAVAGRLHASMGLVRGCAPVADAWGHDYIDASLLPDGTVLEDAISGALLSVAEGRLSMAAVLASFPCALLTVRG
jgi:(1->4)-alpha-D-glucan 1-alpha-D-glucosylmutase